MKKKLQMNDVMQAKDGALGGTSMPQRFSARQAKEARFRGPLASIDKIAAAQP
jgi:hypothetical protein